MQQAHFDLLKSIGVPVTEADLLKPLTPPRSLSPVLPNRPHHLDPDGTPVYTSEQLAWAHPSDFGYQGDFMVVEEEHTSHPLALNFADEVQLPKRRPVHRYCRKERFRFVLGQLMGCSGHVPQEVLAAMDKTYLTTLSSEQVWDAVRHTLKQRGWRIYYNRIPAILSGLGLIQFRFGDTSKFKDILHDFELMDSIFPTLKPQLGRVYFPNLRFTAVKLMHRHGIFMPVTIPLARTQRKLEALHDIYDMIWKAIEQRKIDEFFENLFQPY